MRGAVCSYLHTHTHTRSIIRLLGEGYFSTVYEGTWRLPLRDVKVAVKKANDHLEEKEKVKFLQEASVVGQFNHPHIVRLYGVITEDVTTGEPCVRWGSSFCQLWSFGLVVLCMVQLILSTH